LERRETVGVLKKRREKTVTEFYEERMATEMEFWKQILNFE